MEIRFRGHSYATLVEAMLGEDSEGTLNDKEIEYDLAKDLNVTLKQIQSCGLDVSRRVERPGLFNNGKMFTPLYKVQFDATKI